jgi:hypothetical protein
VHAAACIPNDWEKKSINNPSKNDDKSNAQPGVSKGNSKINII